MGTERNGKNGGVYALWLHLPHATSITVGKLGTFLFQPGIYAYCGSAQRFLAQRVARHARLDKKLHWHIDYLRVTARYLGAVLFYDQPKDKECWLVEELLRIPGAFFPVEGFGSSDCTCCAHLLYFPTALPRQT